MTLPTGEFTDGTGSGVRDEIADECGGTKGLSSVLSFSLGQGSQYDPDGFDPT